MDCDVGTWKVGTVLEGVAMTSLLQRLLSYEVRWQPCRTSGQVEKNYRTPTVQDFDISVTVHHIYK